MRSVILLCAYPEKFAGGMLLVTCILGVTWKTASQPLAMDKDGDFCSPKRKKRCTRKANGQFPTISEDKMAEILKAFVPSNTAKNTQWAVSYFREWKTSRNATQTDGQPLCPVDLLDNPVVEDLNYWLARFVAEMRNEGGDSLFPRASIRSSAGYSATC